MAKTIYDFKAPGAYVMEVDRSETIQQATGNAGLRLFIGSSRRGTVNRPVIITNSNEFTKEFGSIDRELEARGSYFHRSCLIGLQQSPIMCLNLVDIDVSKKATAVTVGLGYKDYTGYTVVEVDTYDLLPTPSGSANVLYIVTSTNKRYEWADSNYVEVLYNGGISSEDVTLKNLYDKSSYIWEVTPEKTISALSSEAGALSFTYYGNDDMNVLIKKSSINNVRQYDVTLEEWYGGDVPYGLDGSLKLSDFFVDVILIAGNYSNITAGSLYENYFKSLTTIHPNRIKESELNKFYNNTGKAIGTVTGCIIPSFVDKMGNNRSIDFAFNRAFNDAYKFVCALDEEKAMSAFETTGYNPKNFSYSYDSEIMVSGEVIAPATYAIYPFSAYKPTDDELHGGNSSVENITHILNKISAFGLDKYLTDKNRINFNYVIDTYALSLTQESKGVLADLAAARKETTAILNAPSASEILSNNNNVDNLTGNYIANNVFGELYSLTSNEPSYAAYYYPFIKIREFGKMKSVPPAAFVSNVIDRKNKNHYYWSIPAGTRRGLIGNGAIMPEVPLFEEDRAILDNLGWNLITTNSEGNLMIYSDNTAQVRPVTALSTLHVRELCNYIENVARLYLQNYVFEFNTEAIRKDITNGLSNFLEKVKINQGVYEYFVQMDERNNTKQIIDENRGVVDIFIEPTRGMRILVASLNIMRTGGIAEEGIN